MASKEWYQQPTQGAPGARARGCAVVAPASDFSSFNIYYYGGFDGIHPSKDFSDQVWVLSLPSFTWTLINEGSPSHARSGHKCFMPYPDQMMAFGGYTSVDGSTPNCLDQGPVVIFNLTSGQWMDTYSPSRYADYGVHSSVVKVVGGDASGGAKVTSPLPSGWSSKALADIFSIAYDKSKLTHYWPYTTLSPMPTARARPVPTAIILEHGTSAALHTLLPAIIVPLVFLIGLVVALWYFCIKKKSRTSYSTSDSTAVDSSRNVIMWLKGHRGSKQLTLTESQANTTGLESTGEADGRVRHEMPDTQVSELCGMMIPPFFSRLPLSLSASSLRPPPPPSLCFQMYMVRILPATTNSSSSSSQTQVPRLWQNCMTQVLYQSAQQTHNAAFLDPTSRIFPKNHSRGCGPLTEQVWAHIRLIVLLPPSRATGQIRVWQIRLPMCSTPCRG